jgi:hypothetical protein
MNDKMVDNEIRVRFGTGEQSNYIEVEIEGMSTALCPGGSILYLEKDEGRWILRVWSDVNQEDPTHRIDLMGALDSNFKGLE